MEDGILTNADLAYIRAGYRSLRDVSREHGKNLAEVRRLIGERQLPAPAYVLADGEEMVPEDYFDFVGEAGGPSRLQKEFERRHRAAGGAAEELEDDWDGYIDGLYGVCLRHVSPETIVRKGQLVGSVERLLVEAAPEDGAWRQRLRHAVDELDQLEREFSPDYDRKRFGTQPSRDRLITASRERYPEVFAEVEAYGR